MPFFLGEIFLHVRMLISELNPNNAHLKKKNLAKERYSLISITNC